MRPVARGFALNLAGTLAPVVAAVVAFPVIAHHAGTERLGFLGLAWTLVGYLGMLDLGLSRVVVRRVALASARDTLADESAVVRRIWMAVLAISIPVSLVGALVPVAWWIGADAPEWLRHEATGAVLWVCVGIPMVVSTSVLRGVLDGLQRFGLSNLLRGLFGVLGYAAPAIVTLRTADLTALVGALVATRAVGFAVQWAATRRALPAPRAGATPPSRRELIREGGWLTVTNVVGPLMVNFDRFALGALESLTAVAAYVVPQEIVLRLLVVPGALASVLYPALSGSRGGADPAAARLVVERSLDATLAAGLPLALAIALAARPAMQLWMGPGFATGSEPVLALFSVGFLFNSIAQVPYASIQASGRADLTGRLHLIELPAYLAMLLLSVNALGAVGAALAWSARACVDCVALLAIDARLDRRSAADMRAGSCALAGAIACAACVGIVNPGRPGTVTLIATAIIVAIPCSVAWGRRAMRSSTLRGGAGG